MHKINKLGLVLILAIIPAFTCYAHTTAVEVKGLAPRSSACEGIEGQLFEITLIMPSSQYHPVQIKHTQGFTFDVPNNELPFNNAGVEGSCDYYLNPVGITIHRKQLTLERLRITSRAIWSACINVKVYLSITTETGSDCEVKLSE